MINSKKLLEKINNIAINSGENTFNWLAAYKNGTNIEEICAVLLANK